MRQTAFHPTLIWYYATTGPYKGGRPDVLNERGAIDRLDTRLLAYFCLRRAEQFKN